MSDKGASHEHPLTLTTRQFAKSPFGLVGHTDSFQGVGDSTTSGATDPTKRSHLSVEPHFDDAAGRDGEGEVEIRGLWDITNGATVDVHRAVELLNGSEDASQ